MRGFARGALAAAFVSFCAAAAAAQGLVGEWESEERSPGGVGELVEFRADGTVRQVSAAMGDATYKLSGEWLLTFWKDRESGKVSVLSNRVELEGLEMLQKDEEGNLVARMRRDGPEPRGGSPIGGRWCAEDGPGLTTFTEFAPDGKMFVRLPIRAVTGRYWLSGTDQLAVELEGSSRREFRFRVSDGVLLVTPQGGTERKFRRPESTLLHSTLLHSTR